LFEPNAGLFRKLSVLAARSKSTVKEGQLVVKILNPNGTPIALFKGTALGDLIPFKTVDMAAAKVMVSINNTNRQERQKQIASNIRIITDTRRSTMRSVDGTSASDHSLGRRPQPNAPH
ncbi:hypothetical protein T02_2248, partial [Trichinella nativa]